MPRTYRTVKHLEACYLIDRGDKVRRDAGQIYLFEKYRSTTTLEVATRNCAVAPAIHSFIYSHKVTSLLHLTSDEPFPTSLNFLAGSLRILEPDIPSTSEPRVPVSILARMEGLQEDQTPFAAVTAQTSKLSRVRLPTMAQAYTAIWTDGLHG